jgi:hypothetical protein
MLENNNKKIIELIKESNVIIIYGGVGRGRKLLFTKLTQYPELAGIIYRGDFKLSDLSTTGNIYIDDLNLVSKFTPSSNPLEIKEQLKQWQEFLSTARKRQQRIFITTTEDLIKVKELADLIITARGLSVDEKDYLSLTIQKGDQT